MNNKNELMNIVVNEIQEKVRVNNLKNAHEIYKHLKDELIQNILNRLEQEVVKAMLEGCASTNIKLTKVESTHGEELSNYFRNKGFNAYCDKFFGEEGLEYSMFIEWTASELNLQ